MGLEVSLELVFLLPTGFDYFFPWNPILYLWVPIVVGLFLGDFIARILGVLIGVIFEDLLGVPEDNLLAWGVFSKLPAILLLLTWNPYF